MSLSSRLITDSSIRLRDGRTLGMAAAGRADGLPIFHCHGNGSSRLEVLTVASAAEQLGVRLMSLDRPGIGRSDPKPGYRLLDWPDDVVEVADQLGIERFAVEGLSGGAPFALACAYKIPHRLTACGLISPATGPFLQQAGSFALRSEVWMLVHLPWLVRALFRLSMRLSGSDEASLEKKLVRAGARLEEADHRLLGIPEIRKAFAQATAESFRQAADASTKDGLVYSRPWGFQVEAITFEQLFLWQGDRIGSCRLLRHGAFRRHYHIAPRPSIPMKAISPRLSTMSRTSGKHWRLLARSAELFEQECHRPFMAYHPMWW